MQIITAVKDRTEQFVAENATTILTAGGVVGVVGTAVLAWRGGYKYNAILTNEIENRRYESIGGENLEDGTVTEPTPYEHPTFVDKAKLVVPYLAPPAITGATTVAAIIFSHKMNAQKAAALAAAYGLSQKQLEEYKNKVAEKLGVKKEQTVQDELAQDRVNNTPGSNQIVVVEGEVLCFDQPTGRYFRSTMESIRSAVNATNAEIIRHDHANASYFYEELGLPHTTWSEQVGWNHNQHLELTFSTVLAPDDKPCIAIDFKTLPKLDYVARDY